MRILFVAMSNSVHTARWIAQIADQGWDIHLFPSYDVNTAHHALHNVTVHRARSPYAFLGQQISSTLTPRYRTKQLAKTIADLKPDIIHTLEFQGAGYLTLAAKKYYCDQFPPWIVSAWGSDIYYFGRFPAHLTQIKKLLRQCNYFVSESERDIQLAQQYGFKGAIWPILPAAGGYDMQEMKKLQSHKPTAQRRLIMLKGYHGWAGRAKIGLQALKLSRDWLQGYTIVMYSTQLSSRLAARWFYFITRIPVTIVPSGTSHTQILKLHGQARISIGLSITDGVPNGMLEAMAMGSFPIQSSTSCADEWLEDGVTGLFVPPENVTAIATAIRRALTKDQLVDQAAIRNAQIITKRVDSQKIKPQVISLYQAVKDGYETT